jgi:serine/threonine protein kinase
VKIPDFGLCGITGSSMCTFCGFPCYAAPECINGVQYDGEAADVWSLGVILYEMVTGGHPWDITNIPRMLKQITGASVTVQSNSSPFNETRWPI